MPSSVAPHVLTRVVQVDAVFSSLDSKQMALRVSSMIMTGGDEVPVVNVWPHITVVCEKVGPFSCCFFAQKKPFLCGTHTQLFRGKRGSQTSCLKCWKKGRPPSQPSILQ